MARWEEACRWLERGFPPSVIASKMGVSYNTVLPYLYRAIGEGVIRRSDILFSIPDECRRRIEQVVASNQGLGDFELLRVIGKEELSVDQADLLLYINLREHGTWLGDLYDDIRMVEITLHEMVRETLEAQYGTEWWRSGVPMEVRKACACRLEEDPNPVSDPFRYTMLIDLATIMDKQWSLFSSVLPDGLAADKRAFLSLMRHVNLVRNLVMHPVKNRMPTEEEFGCVRGLRRALSVKR